MKNIGCACVAISALLYAEYGYGAWKNALRCFKEYEDSFSQQSARTNDEIQDTQSRYDAEKAKFTGTRVELISDGQQLKVSVNGKSKTYKNSEDTWKSISLGEDKKNKLMWYKNSLVLLDINDQSNYSFLADKVYVLGNTTCNELIIGAKEGFMNFGNINAKNIKVCTHSGADYGTITASSDPQQNVDNPDMDNVEQFFFNYNARLVRNAFEISIWRSLGDIKATNIVFDSLYAHISGSMSAKHLETREGMTIANPTIRDDFSNLWLDHLYTNEKYEKAKVDIENLTIGEECALMIPLRPKELTRHGYRWRIDDSQRKISVKSPSVDNIGTYACLMDRNEKTNDAAGLAKFIDFLNKTGEFVGFLSFDTSLRQPAELKGEMTVHYDITSEKNNNSQVKYSKIRYSENESDIETIDFFDSYGYRFNQNEEKRLREFLASQRKEENNDEKIKPVPDKASVIDRPEIEIIEEEEEDESLHSNDLDKADSDKDNPKPVNDDNNRDTPKAGNPKLDSAKKPTQAQPKSEPAQKSGAEKLTPLEEFCEGKRNIFGTTEVLTNAEEIQGFIKDPKGSLNIRIQLENQRRSVQTVSFHILNRRIGGKIWQFQSNGKILNDNTQKLLRELIKTVTNPGMMDFKRQQTNDGQSNLDKNIDMFNGL